VTKDIYYTIFMLIIITISLVYNLYQLWVTPDKYIKKLISSVKDWWPFADFYRKWFASKAYVWLFRIIYTIFLLIVMTILSLLVLGITGIFP